MAVDTIGLTSADIDMLLLDALSANSEKLKANELELKACLEELARKVGSAVQAFEATNPGDQNASALRDDGLRLQQSMLNLLAHIEAEGRLLDDQAADLSARVGRNPEQPL